MPVFQPRNRVQILRDMVARTVSRSSLVGLTRNSAVFHVLAAAANEDAELYFQLARMRDLFSIDKATGSDLDARAREIQPDFVRRRPQLSANGDVVFSRPGTIGGVTVATGTIVAAEDSDGQIKYRTTSPTTIPAGSTDAPPVNAVALEPGTRANVAATEINQFVSRIPGVTSVSNALQFDNGRDRESDSSFRARLKGFVQALSRGTPTALETFAKNVILADGRRVLFAHIDEPTVPDGTVQLFVDDGTGSIEEFSSEFIASPDTLVASAAGGEVTFSTTQKPIRADGSFDLEVNSLLAAPSAGAGFVSLAESTDFLVNRATGQIELLAGGSVPALSPGYGLRASYRYYTGLIQEVQRVMDGDPATPLTRPGVRPAGVTVFAVPPVVLFQSLQASISVSSDFDPLVVAVNAGAAIQTYINGLDIGADVILAQIIEEAMGTDGLFDFTVTNLTGGAPPVNQTILGNQVARIAASSIVLT